MALPRWAGATAGKVVVRAGAQRATTTTGMGVACRAAATTPRVTVVVRGGTEVISSRGEEVRVPGRDGVHEDFGGHILLYFALASRTIRVLNFEGV